MFHFIIFLDTKATASLYDKQKRCEECFAAQRTHTLTRLCTRPQETTGDRNTSQAKPYI